MSQLTDNEQVKIEIPKNVHLSANEMNVIAIRIADDNCRSLIECACLLEGNKYDLNHVDDLASKDVKEALLYLIGRQNNSSNGKLAFRVHVEKPYIWFSDV